MSEPDIEAIRARKDAATPGPWEWDTEDGECLRSLSVTDREYGEFGSLLASYPRAVVMGYPCRPGTGFAEYDGADAEFIAHARTDIPDLLEAVDRLRSMLIDAETEAQMQAAEAERLRGADAIVRRLAAGDYVYDTVSCWFCGSGVKWREGGLSSGATTDAEMYVGQHSDGCLYALALAYVEANPA